jgi:hypothetical protein
MVPTGRVSSCSGAGSTAARLRDNVGAIMDDIVADRRPRRQPRFRWRTRGLGQSWGE